MAGEFLPLYSHLVWLLGERNVSSQRLRATEIHPLQWHCSLGLSLAWSLCSVGPGTGAAAPSDSRLLHPAPGRSIPLVPACVPCSGWLQTELE